MAAQGFLLIASFLLVLLVLRGHSVRCWRE